MNVESVSGESLEEGQEGVRSVLGLFMISVGMDHRCDYDCAADSETATRARLSMQMARPKASTAVADEEKKCALRRHTAKRGLAPLFAGRAEAEEVVREVSCCCVMVERGDATW